MSIILIHDDESLFPNAHAFDPSRFLDARPDLPGGTADHGHDGRSPVMTRRPGPEKEAAV